MKKIYLVCIVVISFAAFTTVNVKMNKPSKSVVNLFLNGVEATAGNESGNGGYECQERTCQVQYGAPPYVIIKDGYWYKCVEKEGATENCSDCRECCDAGIGC